MTWLMLASATLFATAVIAYGLGRITSRRFHALSALGNGINLTVTAACHSQIGASISAAALAIAVWQWWNGGGGDDTKRRLKSWARGFRPVRRTAPVGGAS